MPITACKFDSCPGHNHQAPMAELVDAYVSGAYIERCAGSTPVRGTQNKETLIDYQSVRVFLCTKVPLPCQPRVNGSLGFTPYSIPGNGLANTFGKGVSNSMSCFLIGW